MISGPTLKTDRYLLRPPQASDLDAYLGFATSERARYAGGIMDLRTGWRAFAALMGHWQIRGFGLFAIEDRSTGQPIGATGPYHPGDWPERELGWILFNDASQGKGAAFEAASAARTYVYDTLGWNTAVSYIAAENARSIRLAERLGAVRDDDAPRPGHADCLVFRHPAPGALS